MHQQVAELREVKPQNMVHGFDIEVIRHDENLLQGQVHAEFFVTVLCKLMYCAMAQTQITHNQML
ncbi:hypothetical protein K2P47_04675 [Patescibacteria group bacterium]|nr:hypothetical protein [Patescibacteria group bacterium]